jgi:hypothetical protein
MQVRTIVCFTVLFFLCPGVRAQSNYFIEEPKVFNGGLILGLNFTQVDGDTYYGYHKVGLNAGGVVYAHFSSTFGASMELLYSQKGSRGEDITESPAIGTYVTKYFMNLNYVEVPLALHYIYHRFDVEAGISYAYLITSSEWVQADQPVVIDPVGNAFGKTDLEYIFGLSRRLYKKLYANARFQYSITSVRPADRIPLGYGYGNQGQFNNLFNLRFIYLF